MQAALDFNPQQGQVAFFNNTTLIFHQNITNNNGENEDTTPFGIKYLTIGPRTKIAIYNIKNGFNSMTEGSKLLLIDNKFDQKMVIRLTDDEIREDGYIKSYKIYTFETFSKTTKKNDLAYLYLLIISIIFFLFF